MPDSATSAVSRKRADKIGARTAVTLYFLKRMGPPLLLTALYTAVAATIVQWDMARAGEKTFGFGEALYAMYTQLFFEPTEDLPAAPIARTLFWITPLVGAVLIAEGILKVGAELFNPDARREIWVKIVSERMQGHVVVCGLGHVGYRVVEELRRHGEGIVAIERSAETSGVEDLRALKVPVHIGDARRDEVLVAAGVANAKAVVCATDDDLVNLEVAIDAKRMNPDIRVVMRMFDQRLASKVEGAFDLDRTFSTSGLSAPLVALQAIQRGVRAAYRLDDGSMRVAIELKVGPSFEPKKVSDLEERLDGRIVSLRHEKSKEFAKLGPSTNVLAGDSLVVDAPVDKIAWVRKTLHAEPVVAYNAP